MAPMMTNQHFHINDNLFSEIDVIYIKQENMLDIIHKLLEY